MYMFYCQTQCNWEELRPLDPACGLLAQLLRLPRGLQQDRCAQLCELAILLREQNHLASLKANVFLLLIKSAV